MPVVVIKTAIPLEEYEQRFKPRMERLRMSEYELAQELILIGLNEPQKTEEKRLLCKLAEFFKDDLKYTGT